MTSKSSKTNEPHKFRLSLADKLNLKDSSKNTTLANLSIYYTWKSIKSAYNNNKFKISAPTWNEELDLSDESYSIAYIQNYVEFFIKKRETFTENPQIVFKVKTGYKLEFLSS